MVLNSQAQILLDYFAKGNKPEEIGAIKLRDVFKETRGKFSPPVPDVSLSEDILIPGKGKDIRARYYRPLDQDLDKKLPVLLYFHGGGWVVGDIDTHDIVCRMVSNRGQFSVLSVDYRLAPENKFPAAVEDAWSTYNWVKNEITGLAIDPGNIAVGGDSAGGNLSAVLAIMVRDIGETLSYQALIYPSTSFYFDTESQEQFAKGYLLTKDVQAWYHKQYLQRQSDRDDWRASPLLAEDLRGVAPALVLTCEYDPLRDEGRDYARRLEESGVEVNYHCYDGQIHGFITMGGVIDDATTAINEMAHCVAESFHLEKSQK